MPHIQAMRAVRFFTPDTIPPDAVLLVNWQGEDPTVYVDALERTMEPDEFATWAHDHGPTEERTIAWHVTTFRCDHDECAAEIKERDRKDATR